MKSEKPRWTLKQVSQDLDMNERQIRFYSAERDICPGLSRNVGKGRALQYSNYHRACLLVVREMAGYGMTIRKIKAAMLGIHDTAEDWWDFDEDKMMQGKRPQLFLYGGKNVALSYGLRDKGADVVTVNLGGSYTSALIIDVGRLVTLARI